MSIHIEVLSQFIEDWGIHVRFGLNRTAISAFDRIRAFYPAGVIIFCA